MPAFLLSLFINDKLWIFSVFIIGADEQKIHIGNDAEAAVAAEFTFKLSTEISRAVVKEFDGSAVGERVFEIDEASDEGVQGFDLGHTLDIQRVQLVDQLLFEEIEIFLAAERSVALPIIQRRERGFHIRP